MMIASLLTAADILTILVCVLSIPAMKRAASRNMNG